MTLLADFESIVALARDSPNCDDWPHEAVERVRLAVQSKQIEETVEPEAGTIRLMNAPMGPMKTETVTMPDSLHQQLLNQSIEVHKEIWKRMGGDGCQNN